ncbi:MAG TPA: YqeG family HAD IIIA-type phosphatase [Acholeplasmataceae bacterium]|nr:YqeG family HAD IIIA-type phosphatase [Acholeplasmataceae bacterium]
MDYKKFVPNEVYRSVFDIDFKKLYEDGKRIILTDVDNTLISYDEVGPSEQLLMLHQELTNMGFKIYLISNNNIFRLEKFSEKFINEGFIASARKPLKRGFKRAIKLINRPAEEIIVIGDQIMTDVYGAKRSGLDVVLVKPIKKSTEKWYTRFNRYWENKIVKKIKKVNIDIYNKIINLKEGNDND